MVPVLGIIFWILAFLALVRILSPLVRGKCQLRPVIPWFATLLFASLILFRPHEDLFGGQDPGAYLNAAFSFARHGALFYTDPLLSQAPESSRSEFLYGTAAFAKTKDACLWVHDLKTARIGPWFQPAYSVMMSPLAWLGLPGAVLYVTPLLTLLTGLILAQLAAIMIRRPGAALATFWLYVLNPVIAWNARCPRAEAGAAFFLFAGCALILQAAERGPGRARGRLLLGLTCAALAPFFHVTAWFPLLGLSAVLLLLALRGRTDLLLTLPVALLAVAGFVAQTRFITDCYFLWPRLAPILSHPAVLASVIGIGCIVVGGMSLVSSRRAAGAARAWPTYLVAIVPPMLFLLLHFARPSHGQLPFLTFLPSSLFALTDVQGLVRLSSPVVAVTALSGWVLLNLRSSPARFLLAALLPGLIFTGWMDDYMMETRRLMIVPAAVMALGLAAVVTRIPGWLARPSRGLLVTALTVALILAMGRHKTHLYTLTEYRGLQRFFKPFADIVSKDRGILLAEYSRIAAPFEHRFGLPLLALDSDRRSDYRKAESAWQAIMTNAPSTPAFFLTPYNNPVSEHFSFELVKASTFEATRLPAAPRAIPDSPRCYTLTLQLYRLQLAPTPAESPAGSGPFVRRFDGGNMGMRRFATKTNRPLILTGIPLPEGQSTRISWSPPGSPAPTDGRRSLLLFIHGGADITVQAPGATPPPAVHWTPLTEGWAVAQTHLPATCASLMLRPHTAGALLNNVLESSPDGSRPLQLISPTPQPVVVERNFKARWARTKAELLLPAPGGHHDVFFFMKTDAAAPAGACQFIANNTPYPVAQTGGAWQWRHIPVTGSARRGVTCVVIDMTPPWNPRLPGYPGDLAALFGYAIVTQGKDRAQP